MLKRGLTLAVLFLVHSDCLRSLGYFPAGGEPVPAFNAGPPAKGTKLPADPRPRTSCGETMLNIPYQTHAYELAAKIPAVLHQQPCYCYCDRMGHNSLHSCFESTHGAQCAHLPERAVLLLSATPEGQDRGPDPQRHHRRRMETGRPADRRVDQLATLPRAELTVQQAAYNLRPRTGCFPQARIEAPNWLAGTSAG